MAYTLNNNEGSLFINQKTNDRQPDYRGAININGELLNLAGWLRTSQNGKQYISLKADTRQAETPAPAPAPVPAPAFPSATTAANETAKTENTEDDLPF